MRITNQMMTNSMLSHITQNKINMSTLESQYSTGKKILKPSDDPIVAVRALKLRSNLTELTQYLSKNIPDAESWMDVTESAMDKINSILTSINTYCVQGSSDTLTEKDRTNILQNLIQMKEQIYQEGNSQYAGRYVFTGFKTDTPLIYTSATSYKNAVITQAKEDVAATEDTTKKDADANNTYVFDLNGIEKNLESVSSVTVGTTTYSDVINMTSADFYDGSFTPAAGKAYYLEDTNKLVVGSATAITTANLSVTGERFQGYNLTENFTGDDLRLYSTVIIPTDAAQTAKTVQTTRLQLSYDNLSTKMVKDKDGNSIMATDLKSVSYSLNGVAQTPLAVTKTINSTDQGAYDLSNTPDAVVVLADTGEVLFGKNVADKLKDATNISVNYSKNDFATTELKPEHYFDCSFVNSDGEQIDYTLEKQDITYEVNFKQTLKVNTEAKDVFTHAIDRMVDDITTAVNNVASIETQIATLKEKKLDTSLDTAGQAEIDAKLAQLDTALTLSKSIMQKTFSTAITSTHAFQDQVNVAVADSGSRSKRLELTKDRLEDQKVELEDLKSSNEDVDLVETVIRYKSAESIYTSSLSAAASVIKTNLLNFL